MSQPGETDGYTVQDHIRAIEKHSFKHPVDLVVVNQSKLPKEVLDMYASQKRVIQFVLEMRQRTMLLYKEICWPWTQKDVFVIIQWRLNKLLRN